MADRLAIRLPSVGIHAPWQLREADRRHIRKPCMVVLEREVYEVKVAGADNVIANGIAVRAIDGSSTAGINPD